MFRARVTSLLGRNLRREFSETFTICGRQHHQLTARSSINIKLAVSATGFHGNRYFKIPSAARSTLSEAQPSPDDAMFCYQCEQTKRGDGCRTLGVCGKTPEVAALQDLLVHVVKGMALYGHAARTAGADIPSDVYSFTFRALFSTLTNVNFDPHRFPIYISEALENRETLKKLYENTCMQKGKMPEKFTQDEAAWFLPSSLPDMDHLEMKGRTVGVLSEHERYGADVAGVRYMALYGLKGMATYARHAQLLGEESDTLGAFTLEALSFLTHGPEKDKGDLGENLSMALRVGENNLLGLEMLDKGHRARFGVPTPTEVSTAPIHGKCVLVSGHDLHDLEMILKATEGTGINVYTHGELLPAHSYPELHKYQHFAGHFGGAWQMQKYEFPMFPGPIVITTNCLVEPMRRYKDRMFTLNDCGWPGVKHLELPKDADIIIQNALDTPGFTEEYTEGKSYKTITVGFGHDAILANAGTVLEAIANGQLKRVFLIGGCDGAENKRSYFSTLAKSLPKDTLILTLGCAKYRFNMMDHGQLGDTGLPRLMDMGQCNDAYGAVVVAKALAEALNVDINSLPISYAISWFEQKAVAVLLSLLHLGVKNIRLGPVLPAFLTPDVLDILVTNYNIQPVDVRHPLEDMEIMLGNKPKETAMKE